MTAGAWQTVLLRLHGKFENAQEDHRRGLDAVRAARLQLGMNTAPDRGDG